MGDDTCASAGQFRTDALIHVHLPSRPPQQQGGEKAGHRTADHHRPWLSTRLPATMVHELSSLSAVRRIRSRCIFIYRLINYDAVIALCQLLFIRVFEKVIVEIRAEYGRPPIAQLPITVLEIEMVWGLHAAIFYLGVRQYIYGMPLEADVSSIIDAKVTTFLSGIRCILPAKSRV